jgi:molybdenum cofactor synthesis domain-containing protein
MARPGGSPAHAAPSASPRRSPGSAPRVAVVAIGDELLSGKVRDENVHYLACELRALGAPLVLALIVKDEVAAIVDALEVARARADLVITTGGVGPTHDDVTMDAIAAAFGVDRVRDAQLERDLRAHYRGAVNEDVLAMADLPRGAELIRPIPFFLPIVKLGQVHVLPGDPLSLRALFEPWKETLRQGALALARVELDVDEGHLSPLLRAQQAARPAVRIGSYPRFDAGAPYRVLVTLEATTSAVPPAEVRAAQDELRVAVRRAFGPAALLRETFTESPTTTTTPTPTTTPITPARQDRTAPATEPLRGR